MESSRERIERCSRRVPLKDVGGQGQDKLFPPSVPMAGAGGMGHPALLHSAARGIIMLPPRPCSS